MKKHESKHAWQKKEEIGTLGTYLAKKIVSENFEKTNMYQIKVNLKHGFDVTSQVEDFFQIFGLPRIYMNFSKNEIYTLFPFFKKD